MKVYHLAPFAYHPFNLHDGIFLEWKWASDERFALYRDRLASRSTIMDESPKVSEGVLTETGPKFDWCVKHRELRHPVFVQPDLRADMIGTLKCFHQFIEFIKNYGVGKSEPTRLRIYDWMMVPQGATLKEFLDCLRIMLETCLTDLKSSQQPLFLGLSAMKQFEAPVPGRTFLRETTEANFRANNRIRLLLHLINLYGGDLPAIHLLGQANPAELLFYRNSSQLSEMIVSTDTSSAYVHAKHGIRFSKQIGLEVEKIKENLDPFEEKLDEDPKRNAELFECFVHNMHTIDEFANRR